MQKNKDRPIQKALALDQLKPEKSRQGNPSAMSPGNPEPSASNRSSRHSLSQACGNLPTTAREELAKRVNQSGSVRTIPTLDGRILLDWELYNIALDLGLPVRLEEFQGHDPVAFVVVHHLRHPRWDHGQRAVIAVRLHAWREPGRPEKPVHSTDLSSCLDGSNVTPEAPATTAEMAEAALVSPTFITRAKRVHELGLSGAVISDDLKFGEAYRRVRLVLDAGLDDAVIHEEAELTPPAAEPRSSPTPDCSNGSVPGISTSTTRTGWPWPERPAKGVRCGHLRSPRQNSPRAWRSWKARTRRWFRISRETIPNTVPPSSGTGSSSAPSNPTWPTRKRGL